MKDAHEFDREFFRFGEDPIAWQELRTSQVDLHEFGVLPFEFRYKAPPQDKPVYGRNIPGASLCLLVLVYALVFQRISKVASRYTIVTLDELKSVKSRPRRGRLRGRRLVEFIVGAAD